MFINIKGIYTNINKIKEIAKAQTDRRNGDGTSVVVYHIVYKKEHDIEITEDFMSQDERDNKFDLIISKLASNDSYMEEINSKLEKLIKGILKEDKSSPDEE